MTALLTTAAAISTPGGRDRDPALLRTSSADREGGDKGDREGDHWRSLSR